MERMTITRAMIELKTLDKRIQNAINSGVYAVCVTGGKSIDARYGKDVESFSSDAKARLQSVQDLIENRNKIKSAIVASNAVTDVQIGTVKMKVAEALERKSTGIQYEKQLLNKLQSDLNQAVVQISQKQTQLDRSVDQFVEASFGKDAKAKGLVDDASVNAFIAQRQPALLDPVDIRKQIADLQYSIEEFEKNVDYSLTVSNTLTFIGEDVVTANGGGGAGVSVAPTVVQ